MASDCGAQLHPMHSNTLCIANIQTLSVPTSTKGIFNKKKHLPITGKCFSKVENYLLVQYSIVSDIASSLCPISLP